MVAVLVTKILLKLWQHKLIIGKLAVGTSNPGLLTGYCLCSCLVYFLRFLNFVGMVLQLGSDGNSLGNNSNTC